MTTPKSPVVSFDSESLILVDAEDRELGFRPKSACHDGEGLLHRAFSVFLFDPDHRLLLTRRSQEKRLWPGFWSNTCCSHPRRGERRMKAAHRRTAEELGLEVARLENLYTFTYRARYSDEGSEYEVCTVFAGRCAQDPEVNPREIANWRWIEPEVLDRALEEDSESYSPWLHLEWKTIREEHWSRIQRL